MTNPLKSDTPEPMGDAEPMTPGRAAYEAHMQPEFNHPRLGRRVATWDEIAAMPGEQDRWESIGQAAIRAARAPSDTVMKEGIDGKDENASQAPPTQDEQVEVRICSQGSERSNRINAQQEAEVSPPEVIIARTPSGGVTREELAGIVCEAWITGERHKEGAWFAVVDAVFTRLQSTREGEEERLPQFTWSRVDPGDMDYTEVTLGFGSEEDAKQFRRIVSDRQTTALRQSPQPDAGVRS